MTSIDFTTYCYIEPSQVEAIRMIAIVQGVVPTCRDEPCPCHRVDQRIYTRIRGCISVRVFATSCLSAYFDCKSKSTK